MKAKNAFFYLDPTTQMRLRILMIIMNAMSIISILFVNPLNTIFCTSLNILINLFLLFFTFQIQRAPNFYFGIFLAIIPFALVFSVSDIYNAVIGGTLLTPKHIVSLTEVAILLVFSPAIVKYWREILMM